MYCRLLRFKIYTMICRLKLHDVLSDRNYFSSPGGYKVDFYLPETRQLIQVTQNLNNAPTREREVRALQDAIQALKPKDVLILTDANGKDFKIDGVPVRIRSAAEWMLRPY